MYQFDKRQKTSRLSPPNERTVIDNVACILPSDLKLETLRPLLMRFRLEEIHYLFDNVNDETKNILFYENENIKNIDKKLARPPSVRARYLLAQEQSQIIESIRQIYPQFQLIYYEDMTDQIARIKELYVISTEQLYFIMGDNGENLKRIEQEYNIRARITKVPVNIQMKPNSKFGEALCRILLIGQTDEDVDACYEYLQHEFSSLRLATLPSHSNVPVQPQVEENQKILEAPPWLISHKSDDEDENELNGDPQKDIKARLTRLLENPDPPGA